MPKGIKKSKTKKLFCIEKTHRSLKKIHSKQKKNWNRNEIVYFHAINLIKSNYKDMSKEQLNELLTIFLCQKTKQQYDSKVNCSKKESQMIDKTLNDSVIELLQFQLPLSEIVNKLSTSIYNNLKSLYETFEKKTISSEKVEQYHFGNYQMKLELTGEEKLMKALIDFSNGILDYNTLANYYIQPLDPTRTTEKEIK